MINNRLGLIADFITGSADSYCPIIIFRGGQIFNKGKFFPDAFFNH